MSTIVKMHDEALDHELAIISDTDLLADLRLKMYKNQAASVLYEIVAALNAVMHDAETYKNWVMEQMELLMENQ